MTTVEKVARPVLRGSDLDRPLRILAGPGAGKTRLLCDLYAELIESGAADRRSVLVLTFSTAAAEEIGRRIDARLRDSYDESWISTFHSFCGRLLRRYQPAATGSLIDGLGEQICMRETLRAMGPDQLGELAQVRHSGIFAQDALAFVALVKQNQIGELDLMLQAEAEGSPRMRRLAAIYVAYQKRLREAGLSDFRDLITGAIALLRARPALLATLRGQFRYVLVDEFQDVDPAQFDLLRILAPPEARPRLLVVGDPDQSIYAFRGTVPVLLRTEFIQAYPGARTLRLEASRRCPPEILATGRRLLRAVDPASGDEDSTGLGAGWPEPVQVIRGEDPVEEATAVARTIRTLLLDHPRLRPGDIAILVRSTLTLAAPLEEALAALGLPYRVRDRSGAHRNQVVRFLLAYLAALAEPEGEGRLERLLQSGLSGVRRAAVGRIQCHAQEEGRDFPRVVRRLLRWLCQQDPERYPLPWARADGGPPSPVPEIPAPDFAPLLAEEDRDALHRALAAFYGLRGAARRLPIHGLAYRVLIDTGVLARLTTREEDGADPGRERALSELRTTLEAFGELQEVWTGLHGSPPLLAEVAAQLPAWIAGAALAGEHADAGDRGAAVQIMTAHQAKGLEFEVVFVSGFSEGQFPLAARPHPVLDGADQAWLEARAGFQPSWPRDADAHLAEEARLAYVAMTRARRRLYLTFAGEYERAAGPSPFLDRMQAPEPAAAARLLEARDPDGVLTRQEAELLLAGIPLDEDARRQLQDLGIDVRWLADEESGLPFVPYGERALGVDIRHFSPTSLNDYLRCPRLYYYNHHPGLSSPPRGVPLTRGTFLHRVLENFHNGEDEWWGRPPEVQRAWLEQTLEPLLGDYLDQIEAVLERDREESEVRRILRNYITFITGTQTVRRLRTLVTEKRFVLDLDGAQVRGKIDRVVDSGDGTCEVIDYKTGRGSGIGKTYERYFGERLHDVQLLMYEIACREGVDETGTPLGFRPGLLSVWFPKDWVYGGVRQSLFPVGHEALGVRRQVQHPIGPDDIQRGRGIATEAIRRIQAGDFKPDPRDDVAGTCLHWIGCPHQAICPFGGSAPE